MMKRRFTVGFEARKLVEQAIEKCLPVTLTLKPTQTNNCVIYKSQFLILRSNRLMLSEPIPDDASATVDLAPGQEVAVSFKKGYNKCLFITRILSRQPETIEEDLVIPVLTVLQPECIEKIQRRAYNRVSPPENQPVTVMFSPVDADERTKPYTGQLANISAGGLGVIVPDHVEIGLMENQQVNLHFNPMPQQEPIDLQCRFRHHTQANEPDHTMLGFQIIGLEVTEQGRATLRRLSRIINLYQRQKQLVEHPELFVHNS